MKIKYLIRLEDLRPNCYVFRSPDSSRSKLKKLIVSAKYYRHVHYGPEPFRDHIEAKRSYAELIVLSGEDEFYGFSTIRIYGNELNLFQIYEDA